MEYVENYYEEILSNPRRLIEEMRELLTSTDSEIIAWLEQNHEDYQTATDATREEMRLGCRKCSTICADIRRPIGMKWNGSSRRATRRS